MSMSRKKFGKLIWTTRLASLVGVGTALLLLVGVGAEAQPPAVGDLKTVTGTVKSFTTAPRGEVDGAVLDDGTVIHWPPHLADRFTDIIGKGDKVKVIGRMETGPEGDTHLEVQTATNLRTKASVDNDGPPPPPPGPRGRGKAAPPPPPPGGPRRADSDSKTVQGTVKRFTTAPMGEVDGAVLDDDTVIHWPPHLADRFTKVIAKGDKVKVIGWMETGPEGDTHLEVQTATNLSTKASVDNDGRHPRRPVRHVVGHAKA